MKNRIWIKLYLEILDDPKMGRLPDSLWRFAVECFLLAGKKGDDGVLPAVEDIAWSLHLEEEKVEEYLGELGKVEIVHEEAPGNWVVSHFANRQVSESAERVARYRARYSNVVSNEEEKCDVTESNEVCNADVAADSSTSSSSSISNSISESNSDSLENEGFQNFHDISPGEEKPDNVFKVYEQNIGALTPMIADALREAETTDGAVWVVAAIEEAVRSNARSWKYCEAILQRWRRDGFQVDNKTRRTGSRQRVEGKLTPEQLQTWVENSQAGEIQ